MTVAEILREADRLGVTLKAKGDQIHYRAPKGTITPEFRQTLLQHRPHILRALKYTSSQSATRNCGADRGACLHMSAQDEHWLVWLESWQPKDGERIH